MTAHDFLRINWAAIAILTTAVVIGFVTIELLRSMPPRSIVMATGPEGGTYYEDGKRYRAVLARENVDVRLVPTSGSVENVAMLLDPHSEVSVGLVQGGTIDADGKSELQSLGTIFYEPYWWFRRRDIQGVGVPSLRGRKISIGPEGSGTRALSLQLLKKVGIVDEQASELLPLPPRVAQEKLLAGEIDVAFILASWDSPVVQQLLGNEAIEVVGFPRADALVALYPFLNKLVVPRGTADLIRDHPASDLALIGTKASLVVHKDLHPAIQYLLLQAAQEIHWGPSIFNKASEFPAGEAIDVPLSSEAQRFYKSGLPFLHEYMPFWMATLVGRLMILLIPIFGLLYPLMRLLPQLYDWMIRSKVLRMYRQLRSLEGEMTTTSGSQQATQEVIARIDRLDEQVKYFRRRVAYAMETDSMLSVLHDQINMVRESAKVHSSKSVNGVAARAE